MNADADGGHKNPRGDDEQRMVTPTRAVVLEPGESPWSSSDGEVDLLFTGHGAFVIHREALYAYGRPATVRDFQAVFKGSGQELALNDPWRPCKLTYPLPHKILFQAWGFLKEAWRQYRTEDILLIFFSLPEKQYFLAHPELRYASHDAVGFTVTPAPAGAVSFGTIHGHPLAAFHSLVDEKDVRGIPGLHVVLGGLIRTLPSVACFLSTGGECFAVHPCDVFASARVRAAFPSEWLQRPAELPRELVAGRKGGEE